MNGVVDDFGRTLIRLRLRHPTTKSELELDVWIDTAFTGDLVLPEKDVKALDLPISQGVKAVLADGSEIEISTYPCQVLWFGKWIDIEVLANHGQNPLLGYGMLRHRVLNVDYPNKTVVLS